MVSALGREPFGGHTMKFVKSAAGPVVPGLRMLPPPGTIVFSNFVFSFGRSARRAL